LNDELSCTEIGWLDMTSLTMAFIVNQLASRIFLFTVQRDPWRGSAAEPLVLGQRPKGPRS